jgi:cathepsin C
MVYDEGILVEFPSAVFFTYFMYTTPGSASEYESHCDKTMVGWVRGSSPRVHSDWGCFFAEKKVKLESTASSLSDFQWVQPKTVSFLQRPLTYEEQSDYVDELNNSQTLWKAGLSERFAGKTLAQVNQSVGVKQNKAKEIVQAPIMLQTQVAMPEDKAALLSSTDQDALTAFLRTPIDSIPAEALPKAWDWADIDGVNYVSQPREQGDCGSCYTISTVEMLESRLRIKTGQLDIELLSEQYLVSCSFYTEGCGGGYPTLLNKFISEFSIVPQHCLSYKEKDAPCLLTCDLASLKQKVTVTDFYYVGGFYGASDEDNMMKEIRARGPIIANFEPPYDFSYYQSGIYSRVSNRKPTDGPSEIDMRDENVAWEKVDHSVLITGWGEEDGEKYWKVLNSWGTRWGEDGYFRIKRGTDECAIESMAEASVPDVVYS